MLRRGSTVTTDIQGRVFNNIYVTINKRVRIEKKVLAELQIYQKKKATRKQLCIQYDQKFITLSNYYISTEVYVVFIIQSWFVT